MQNMEITIGNKVVGNILISDGFKVLTKDGTEIGISYEYPCVLLITDNCLRDMELNDFRTHEYSYFFKKSLFKTGTNWDGSSVCFEADDKAIIYVEGHEIKCVGKKHFYIASCDQVRELAKKNTDFSKILKGSHTMEDNKKNMDLIDEINKIEKENLTHEDFEYLKFSPMGQNFRYFHRPNSFKELLDRKEKTIKYIKLLNIKKEIHAEECKLSENASNFVKEMIDLCDKYGMNYQDGKVHFSGSKSFARFKGMAKKATFPEKRSFRSISNEEAESFIEKKELDNFIHPAAVQEEKIVKRRSL